MMIRRLPVLDETISFPQPHVRSGFSGTPFEV